MIEISKKQTKVICSFDGSHCVDLKEQIHDLKTDVLRLVYSRKHAGDIIGFMKSYLSPTNLNRSPIMLDISTWSQGHLITQEEKLHLNFADTFTVTPVGKGGQVEVQTELWDRLFNQNSVVYFGYGRLVAKVNKLSAGKAELEVLQGGWLHKGMALYVPDTRLQTNPQHIKAEDFAAFSECPMDFLIIPGHWKADDIDKFSHKMKEIGGESAPWIIAKIDSQETYQRLAELLPHVHGVMISRREMSLTMNPAVVPMVTKEITQACNNAAKIVVTASEMFSSMRFNATPTRAEVSDVANAVIDGTDAVILSEGVSEGTYGAKALSICKDVIEDIESQTHVSTNWLKIRPEIKDEMDAVTFGAYQTALRVGAKAIVTITKSGNTALRLSSYRLPIPIIAVTFSAETRDRLKLVRGVETLYLDIPPKIDNVLPTVNDFLIKESWLEKGDPIIFVTVTLSSISEEASNLFTIQKLQ